MDNVFIDTFWFFVPNRLVWDNWAKFNGEQTNPDDSTEYVVPEITDNSLWDTGDLGDYFGLPIGTGVNNANALPFRAYNLIWNEWFRDQNLQQSVPVPTGDGPDGPSQYQLLRRGKRHDYFTSCLPWPQKGDPVTVPLGQLAPIIGPGLDEQIRMLRTDSTTDSGTYLHQSAATENAVVGPGGALTLNENNLFADLSSATGFTINQLRESFQIQKLLERDARGGTRYTEIIRSHFGVISPDARLQRPEFLGGGTTMLNVNPVPQTSQTDTEASPQGNLAAFGTASAHNHGFTKSFTEHGYIIGLVNVRADLSYQQRKDRLWSRKSRFDFFWPALAHLGEQAVLNEEIHFSGTPATDAGVFGYQERYGEYRHKPSVITGQFRSVAATPLDYWHLSQQFTETPVLGDQFIQDDPPIDRVIAVPSEPHFLLDCYFQYRSARPMPMYGVPGLIDHF